MYALVDYFWELVNRAQTMREIAWVSLNLTDMLSLAGRLNTRENKLTCRKNSQWHQTITTKIATNCLVGGPNQSLVKSSYLSALKWLATSLRLFNLCIACLTVRIAWALVSALSRIFSTRWTVLKYRLTKTSYSSAVQLKNKVAPHLWWGKPNLKDPTQSPPTYLLLQM